MRIAVISPFVDRRHGTERAVAELIDRLANQHEDEIDLYAQYVAGINEAEPAREGSNSGGRIRWLRVGQFPGPHLAQFLGWLFMNWQARRRVARTNYRKPDVVFSPGVNALDADVILVHAVFHRLAELQATGDSLGVRGLHRKLYYSLLCNLERRIYRNPGVVLAAVSKHTAEQLEGYFDRRDVAVIPNGVDARHFSQKVVAALREDTRKHYQIAPSTIVFLLVGNDWRNKGLRALLAATAFCKELPLRLLIIGQDGQAPFRAESKRLGVDDRVEFFSPVEDVRCFYAAADVLVAPSLEDSFNLPALEAMACGLPVIVSSKAGVSEWLTHGFDCLLLKDPQNASELADAMRAVATQPELCRTLAGNAIVTARKFSWDEHVEKLRGLLETAAKRKVPGG